MPSGMKIAILMTCYNRVETTLRCLSMVVRQELPAGVTVQVYLVDDGSPDGTGDRVRRQFPEVKVIAGSGQLFWAKGMALAWKTAAAEGGFDAYLWLNDDVELSPCAIADVLEDFVQVGRIGVVVGSCSDETGFVCYGCRGAGGVCRGPTGRPERHLGNICGNFVFVPHAVYGKIGGMAECYHHAYGDFDYALRLRKAGIPYYLGSKIAGVCPDHNPDEGLYSPSLSRRLRDLFLPKGRNLHDNFIYKFREGGLVRALASCLHVVYLVARGRKRNAQ